MLESRDIKLSETATVTVKDLNAYQARRADEWAGRDGNPAAVRALCAITHLNGEQRVAATVLPVERRDGLRSLEEALTQREFNRLVSEYAEAYVLDDEQREELKNSLNPLS